MNDSQQIPCGCAACSGPECLCGCRQAAAQADAQTVCACGPQCRCGAACNCGPACSCASS